MKLYLTSFRVPDVRVLSDLVGKEPSKTKLAIIPNGKDYYAPRARRVKIRVVEDALRSYGFRPAIFEMLEYKSPAKLKEALAAYDMLWVMGGNTFCLREAMQRSGFDKIIHEVVEGGLVFAGESAGACVAGTDLHGVELLDDPEFPEKVIWSGLKLIPNYIIPHADNQDLVSFLQPLIEQRGNEPGTIVLNDNQAWVVNGADAWKITDQLQSVDED